MFNLNKDQLATVWIGAFRYYLGRMTYAVGDFCQALIQEWDALPEPAQNLIKRELEEAFAVGEGRLGMDCDKAEWEKVRELWIQPQKEQAPKPELTQIKAKILPAKIRPPIVLEDIR